MRLRTTIISTREVGGKTIDLGDGRVDTYGGFEVETEVEVEGDVESSDEYTVVDVRVISPAGYVLTPVEVLDAEECLVDEMREVERVRDEGHEAAKSRAWSERREMERAYRLPSAVLAAMLLALMVFAPGCA